MCHEIEYYPFLALDATSTEEPPPPVCHETDCHDFLPPDAMSTECNALPYASWAPPTGYSSHPSSLPRNTSKAVVCRFCMHTGRQPPKSTSVNQSDQIPKPNLNLIVMFFVSQVPKGLQW